MGKADGQSSIASRIEFDAEFTPPVATPALAAGGQAHIAYDPQRFFSVYDGQSPHGWFASEFHCYGYGCCEVTFPQIDAHHRFDRGEIVRDDISSGDLTLDVPQDAASLEMWFEAPGFEIRTWYCGCGPECAQENYENSEPRWVDRQGWDSAFGQNYRFEVGSEAFEVVHGEDVKLVTAEVAYDGCPSCGRFTGQVEVRNSGYHKRVQVLYTVIPPENSEPTGDDWRVLEAEFLGMSQGDGFERWSFATTGAPFIDGRTRFAIRYQVNGEERWDNNCGWDYELGGPGGRATLASSVTGHSCE